MCEVYGGAFYPEDTPTVSTMGSDYPCTSVTAVFRLAFRLYNNETTVSTLKWFFLYQIRNKHRPQSYPNRLCSTNHTQWHCHQHFHQANDTNRISQSIIFVSFSVRLTNCVPVKKASTTPAMNAAQFKLPEHKINHSNSSQFSQTNKKHMQKCSSNPLEESKCIGVWKCLKWWEKRQKGNQRREKREGDRWQKGRPIIPSQNIINLTAILINIRHKNAGYFLHFSVKFSIVLVVCTIWSLGSHSFQFLPPNMLYNRKEFCMATHFVP